VSNDQAIQKATNGANGNQAVMKGPQARLQTIKALFDKSKGSIAAVLPKHLTPERLIKIATSAASRSPELLDCTPESLLLAVVQAGTLGLEPNTPLHHCSLVAVNNNKTGKKEANLWIEYRGFCQLAYQSEDVTSIYAHTVFENDDFDFEYGNKPWIRHRYDVRKDRGESIAYYAVVRFKHGGEDFKVLSKFDVQKIRDASPAPNSPAWVKTFDAMGEKSVIRRVLKTAPMSQDKGANLARAIDHDSRAERGATAAYDDIVEVMGEVVDNDTGEVFDSEQSRTEAMKKRISEQGKANAS